MQNAVTNMLPEYHFSQSLLSYKLILVQDPFFAANDRAIVVDRLKAQRQAMVPELERYKQYAQRLEKHRARKMDFLENWSRLLEASTKSLHVQVNAVNNKSPDVCSIQACNQHYMQR